MGMANLLHTAVLIVPQYEPALIPLIRMHIVDGQYEVALSMLDRGLRDGLDSNVYWVHRAWIAKASGQAEVSRRALNRLDSNAARTDKRVLSTIELMNQPVR
jgi:hypothetical protein